MNWSERSGYDGKGNCRPDAMRAKKGASVFSLYNQQTTWSSKVNDGRGQRTTAKPIQQSLLQPRLWPQNCFPHKKPKKKKKKL